LLILGTIFNISKGKLSVQLHEGGRHRLPLSSIEPSSAHPQRFHLEKYEMSECNVEAWSTLLSYALQDHRPEPETGHVAAHLLQQQHVRLHSLLAFQELFRSQGYLRGVLRRPALHWLAGAATSDKEEVCNEPCSPVAQQQGLLVQRLLAKATQPALIKACYTKEELEVGI
jgi:hypothetical protein